MNIKNNRILILGLGNPNYDNTVHNIGSKFIQEHIKNINGEPFKECYISNINKNIYFAFNVSVMNTSGIKVREILKKNNIKNLIVLYDDIRVKNGSYKIVFGGSHTGHNGIKSIVENCISILNNKDFYRVRIGVGPKPDFMELSNYVLSKITEENNKKIFEIYGDVWINIYKICKEILEVQ